MNKTRAHLFISFLMIPLAACLVGVRCPDFWSFESFEHRYPCWSKEALFLCNQSTPAKAKHHMPVAIQVLLYKKIPINQANVSEMQLVDGVGPVLGARLEKHRRINGQYKTFNDLLKIKGVGPKKAEKLSTQIVFHE